MKSQSRFIVRAAIGALALLFLLSYPLLVSARKAVTSQQTAGSKAAAAAEVVVADGLQTVRFDTIYGKVIVNLPDEMIAGDTISGTVVAEPKGDTKEERDKNQNELQGYVVEIGDKPTPSSDRRVRVQVAAPGVATPAVGAALHYKLNSDSGPTIPVILQDKTGTQVETRIRLTFNDIGAGAKLLVPPPANFQLPTIGQQGQPVEVFGPFDGDSSNTTLNWSAVRSTTQDFEKNTENVSGGFGLMAESPRKCVFRAPAIVAGPIQLRVTEGTTVTSGDYRNVGVNLSAPKTNLIRGERTTLTVQVNGLQGIQKDVPLQLDATGVITLAGGNFQNLRISPSDVNADGIYSTQREVTGVQAGGWACTAKVIVSRFDICLQDDTNPQTVLLFNTFTGDYIFTQPQIPAPGVQAGGPTGQTGFIVPLGSDVLTGPATGKVTTKGCTISLDHNPSDRGVTAKVDTCTHAGSASVQTSPPKAPKVKFTITDRNTTNNTCSCGPGCR